MRSEEREAEILVGTHLTSTVGFERISSVNLPPVIYVGHQRIAFPLPIIDGQMNKTCKIFSVKRSVVDDAGMTWRNLLQILIYSQRINARTSGRKTGP